MEDKGIFKIFKECQAIKEGHFLLSSGLHSQKYLQAASVLKYPDKAELLCKELVEKLKDKNVDVVIGPAIGGIILSYQIAKLLSARSIFAERENDKMTLRRNFQIYRNEKILIVEDVLTTGTSVKELINLAKDSKAEIKAIATLVDRSEGVEFKDIQFISLVKFNIKTYRAQECPLCKRGLPLVKPGSRRN